MGNVALSGAITGPKAGQRRPFADFGDTWIERERPVRRDTVSIQVEDSLNLHGEPGLSPTVSAHKNHRGPGLHADLGLAILARNGKREGHSF